jgi:hypothetical protein
MGWAGLGLEGGNVSASGHVVVSTIAAYARNLNGMLIDLNHIGLMGISLAVNAGARGVKRTEGCDWSIHLQSGEEAVATLARAIIASVNRRVRIQPSGNRRAMATMPVMGLMVQSDSIRQLAKIHSRSPRSQSLRTTRQASSDLKEKSRPRLVKSRVVNSD